MGDEPWDDDEEPTDEDDEPWDEQGGAAVSNGGRWIDRHVGLMVAGLVVVLVLLGLAALASVEAWAAGLLAVIAVPALQHFLLHAFVEGTGMAERSRKAALHRRGPF